MFNPLNLTKVSDSRVLWLKFNLCYLDDTIAEDLYFY